MTDHCLLPKIGAAEQLFRFFDQAGAKSPLCRTNLVSFLEFDLLSENPPSLDELKNLIRQKLPALPCLRHFLDEQNGIFQWSAYQPDLEQAICEKKINADQFQDEIISILKTGLPHHAPWKIFYFTGYAPNKFALIWLIRHETLDGGGTASLFEELFTQTDPASPAPLPKMEKAISIIPPHLLKISTSAEEAGRFWKNIPSSLERKLSGLQIPTELLSEIGRKFSASANDIYLAAMSKAIWKWRETYPAEYPKDAKLPIIVPVNLRQPGDRNIGNCFYMAKIHLSADSDAKDVAGQMDIFRDKNIREALRALYKENPDIAAAQSPSPEYFSSACSSFRVTAPMTWAKNPLSRMAIAFNAIATNMPVYSMLCTYAPKNEPKKSHYSVLFISLDSEIKNIEKIPSFWKEAIETLAQEANIDLSAFGEDSIRPFC